MNTRTRTIVNLTLWGLCLTCCAPLPSFAETAGRRFDHSDSDKRYLHHIILYDTNNQKISPESDQPYSPQNTCGRCHDYDTISHGWHFNAFRNDATRNGRPGEPWIWTDERTGTQLPLSYRDWPGRFNPTSIGLSELEMTRHFGGRLPGGGAGSADDRAAAIKKPTNAPESEADTPAEPSRWTLTGDLEVDCMVCHAVSGAYDFELRRDTIAAENFAWAPTAALRLGGIDGSVARIKEGSDPQDDATKSKLPKVTYNANRFNADGTVFMDLVRKVENNACYQCHSQRSVTLDGTNIGGIDEPWVHDQDVHIRAGMNCTDCHRNGIDHQITRGFEGELQSPAAADMATLSCVGCHLGTDFYLDEEEAEASLTQREIANRPGRLGAPIPQHAGLPPIHFEKLTCTACHSGPIPKQTAAGLMTSLAHGLGEKAHRNGSELPSIRGPLFMPWDMSRDQANVRTTVARGIWPAFWGELHDGVVTPLSPEKVYTATRKSLRVRRGFIEEISRPELSSKELAEVLGPERAKINAGEYTDEERKKIAALQLAAGDALFDEKVSASLEAIQTELGVETAVYVSTGTVYGLVEKNSPEGGEENAGDVAEPARKLREISVKNADAVDLLPWPMAHNVRPAGWSLGATGCLECHAEDGLIFASTVIPVGPSPKAVAPLTMANLQGIADADRLLWNQLFTGRSIFKVLIATSLTTLAGLMLIGLFTIGRGKPTQDATLTSGGAS
jgi:hypothetical protein